MSRKHSFLKGATILGLAGILIKILGACFKIPLSNKLGDVGMSYFMAPYPIYNWILKISTAGIPTALAKMIAKRKALDDIHGIFRILQVIFIPMIIIAITSFALLFFSADFIAELVGLDSASIAFRAIAPALLFVPLMSVLRGFFQGIQSIKPFAISQIVEQLVRVFVGLYLAFTLFDKGLEYSAAGATFGATAGSFAGLIVIFSIYLYTKRTIFKSNLKDEPMVSNVRNCDLLRQIIKIAIPITIGASIIPVMNTMDLFIIVNRLNSIGIENAEGLYGILTAFAITIVNFPQIFTSSIQISMVPAVTQVFVDYKSALMTGIKLKEKKINLNNTINTGIKFAMIIAIPCAVGLVTLSEPIMLLVFPKRAQSGIVAADIMNILGWNLIGLGLYQTTTGILQGLEKQSLPPKHLGVGLIVKVVLSYTLVGIRSINVKGAAISSIMAYAVASSLNLYRITMLEDIQINLMKLMYKPLISALLMGVYVLCTYERLEMLMGLKIAVVLTIIISAVIYGFCIIIFKTLKPYEYDLIPGGIKLKHLAMKIDNLQEEQND